jgi:hypothetical protein
LLLDITWTASHVFVRFEDPRSLTEFVWVRARDVRRRQS